jgi:rRNA maturation endonuclease Nob1
MEQMITCEECEEEFEIVCDTIVQPEFCPFCGSKLAYDDLDLWESLSDDETDEDDDLDDK